jgi:hypothetical protein
MENISLDKALKIAGQFMNENTIGVEIECYHPKMRGCYTRSDQKRAGLEISGEIGSETNLNCTYEGYSHRLTGAWKVVTDGSLSDGGLEIVSPPLKPVQLFKDLAVLLPYLESVGVTVNRSCSVHMHHDAKRLKKHPKRLQYFLNHITKNEENFDMLVAESRRNSRWASSNVTELDVLIGDPSSSRCNDLGVNQCPNGSYIGDGRGDARYRKWNFHSLALYGTLENRQHGGSLDFSKYVIWAMLTQGMIARCTREVKKTTGYQNPMHNLLLSTGLVKTNEDKKLEPINDLASDVIDWIKCRMTDLGFGDKLPKTVPVTYKHMERVEFDHGVYVFCKGVGLVPFEAWERMLRATMESVCTPS